MGSRGSNSDSGEAWTSRGWAWEWNTARVGALLEEVRQAVEALPERFDPRIPGAPQRVREVIRWMLDGGRDAADGLRRFELTVNARSRPIEKQWYRDALDAARDAVAATAVWEAWRESSGYNEVEETYYRKWVSQEPRPEPYTDAATRHRAFAKLAKRLDEIGDPTAPNWRPPWRSRLVALRHRLNVASSYVEPDKPRRRTVYVPLKDGELHQLIAEVYADRTARLPPIGLVDYGLQFPAGSRVQCEWRHIDGRTALVAVALAAD